MKLIPMLALAVLGYASAVLAADPPAVTEADVRGWLARIPSEGSQLGAHPLDAQPAGFDRSASADVVAAIAKNARTREEAALLTVFAAYESGARTAGKDGRCIGGDGHPGTYRSYGAWQENIEHAGMVVACDANLAARWWIALRDEAAARCPEAPLAPIIGGCNIPKARRQAAERAALAARLAR